MSIAEITFKAAFYIIFGTILTAGVIDGWLIGTYRESISDWLCDNPGWYVWGGFALVFGVMVLGVHLYTFRE